MVLRTLFTSLLLVAGPGRAAVAGTAAPAKTAVAPARSAADSARAPVLLQDILEHADSVAARSGGRRAEKARIYLRWNAPYGMRRASTQRSPRAHDPLASDTLWLSFLPGRSSEGFVGFTADLYFRAAEGDTLGAWWHMEGAGQNRGAMKVDFGPDGTFPQRQPWAAGGAGAAKIFRTSASSRLHLLFAVPYTEAVRINPDSVYTLCRVVLSHTRVLPGCSQPVCVEWATAALSYSLREEPIVNRGERFVSYASDKSACDAYLPMTVKSAAPPAARTRPGAPSRKRAR